MVEIRTEKMIPVTEVKFVADDGTVFEGEDSKRKCLDYERTCNVEKVKEVFKRLDAVKIKMPFVSWYDENYEFWKVVLNSKADYIALVDYFKFVERCDYNETEEPCSYPYTAVICTTYDTFYEYGSVDGLKDELQKALEQLGTE